MQNIILLHGALGCSNDLNPLAKKLETYACKVYLFEFSGHGKTPFENKFTISQFARELEQFILTNNLKQSNVFAIAWVVMWHCI